MLCALRPSRRWRRSVLGRRSDGKRKAACTLCQFCIRFAARLRQSLMFSTLYRFFGSALQRDARAEYSRATKQAAQSRFIKVEV